MDQSIAGNDAGAGMNMGEATLERIAGLSRRNFLKMAVATSVAMGAAPRGWMAEQTKEGMPYRLLGRMGERVSAIGLGGYHIGEPKDEKEGIGIIRSAIDRGINFMDNCWDYHEGGSEIRMGKALRDGYRDKVFLMTKIDGRTKQLASKRSEERRVGKECRSRWSPD